ncbi:hypothetical protein Emtol_0969 [Emticicia oligotrophica DSM 17448]|uniref:Uncharacterized protein n=1 Tax=Emticicia oligotrophica (strain DSM 17448 / CIP 109782 / MTCC 6937 / GPTSA100-15) TaxID=929562 RepID=A0ABM5MY80_EMTOG|nr:hypothetical protein [Emticicia oligotrophica]AFK02120.1 hypothetical protein Emtol_0969 [Emticicia oligotrophica DSM 17448]
MKFKLLTINILILLSFRLFAQESPKIVLPTGKEWTQIKEGSEVSFELKVEGKNCEKFRFSIPQGKLDGMAFDSLGRFTWIPPYSMVERLEPFKFHQVIFEAKCDSTNETISSKVEFRIQHVNRSPIIRDLKPFYVQYNTNNVYKIDRDFVFDEDNDPIVFIPSFESMPEGMKMTSQGEISWSPSLTQFKKLKEKTLEGNPMYLDFYVEDQPAKSQTKGRLKIEVTQIDLPPEIIVVPKDNVFKIKENQTVNLRFYLSDPNGDDDIHEFDFLTENQQISKKSLIKNTSNQYEFTWQPGYDFVKDPLDSLGFNMDFFVLDKTKKRDVKTIRIVVKNTVNEAETDLKLYNLYRGTLVRGWELLEQLKDKEAELKKLYTKAKKGKKHRSVINASLGATTSLSSVFVPKDKPDQQRLISTLGGTTVLTIGTLEATEVIGRSMKDIIDRLNYIIEKKNEIQSKGDIFSRDFALKSSRRNQDFLRKVDDFMNVMSLKGLVVLDLDASWEPKSKATDANIKKTFKDFSAEENK